MSDYNRIEDLVKLFSDIDELISLENMVSSIYSSLLLRFRPVESMDKFDFTVDDIMDMMLSCSFGIEDEEVKTITKCNDIVTKFIEPLKKLASENNDAIKYSEIVTKNGVLVIFRSSIKLDLLENDVSAKTAYIEAGDKIFSLIIIDEAQIQDQDTKIQLICHEITHYVLNESSPEVYCGATDKDFDLFIEFICDYIGYKCIYNSSWYTNMTNDLPKFNEAIRDDYESFIDAFHNEFDNVV